MQKITITIEHEEGSDTVSFERPVISGNDPLFWEWFKSAWETLGFGFISKEFGDYE